MFSLKHLVALTLLLTWVEEGIKADKPCAPRDISGRSVVCVCNGTYCDEVTRQHPPPGVFIAYTSSEGGLRFRKSVKNLRPIKKSTCCLTLDLNFGTLYSTVEGFGGAVTDAAGIHWKSLPEDLQSQLINSYYSDTGLQYNMVRVPIGGCDFSTHPYAYNDLPENDTQLSNFTLAYEDFEYKIPMIKKIMETSKVPVKVVATTWSPPVWMKTNHQFYGSSRLKPEYFQTYADYHYKFIEKYSDMGIPIWAITTTNEPVNGIVPIAKFNCLGWSPKDMGKWVANNLGPTIRNSSKYRDVKILAVDDQRYSIPLFFDMMIKENPKALNYVDGVAVHYYGDFLTPASFLSHVPKTYPGKFVLATEACEGSYPWETEKVSLGSWQRAKNYILDIMQDLNHDVVGWIDWNLCLDKDGGPNWANNFVDSPVIVYAEKGEFVKQPMFYAMGHFSKFLPQGSRRIKVEETKPFFVSSIDNVAFYTPLNTVVVILYNNGMARQVVLTLGGLQADVDLEAHSVTTVEMLVTDRRK